MGVTRVTALLRIESMRDFKAESKDGDSSHDMVFVNIVVNI